MRRFDHMTIDVNEAELNEELEKRSARGWELVTAYQHNSNSVRMFFKRPMVVDFREYQGRQP